MILLIINQFEGFQRRPPLMDPLLRVAPPPMEPPELRLAPLLMELLRLAPPEKLPDDVPALERVAPEEYPDELMPDGR